MWFRKKKQEPEKTLEEQLIDAKVELARMKKLPLSNWSSLIGSYGVGIVEHSVDRRANDIAYAEAYVVGLETRLRLIPTPENKSISND